MRIRSAFILVLSIALFIAACTPGAPAPTATPVPSGGSDAPPADAGDSGADASAGGSDTTTGLVPPPFSPPPSGSTAPEPVMNYAHGSAVLVINGDLPITYTGGDCDVIGDETYLTIYPGDTPGASLIIYTGTSLTRQGWLVWATSGRPEDNAGVSNEDPLNITLNEDGFSGSFEGRAFRVGSGGVVATQIAVSGTFTCIPQLLRIGGAHPVDLRGVACTAGPFTLRVGNPSSDAALLLAEDGATAGSTVNGGLSWRVGGVSYTTNWLTLVINADGVSGSYYGEGVGPDGAVFPVNGAFNCLGG
jgi:hypothetical protein